MYKNNSTKFVLFLLFSLLCCDCANVVAPSGGEGNKIPPTVENASINQAQTNFSESQITLEFNKYMNRNAVTENIIVSPTTKYSYKWNAKKLSIIFSDSLKKNTTYSVQLGGAVSDFYGNVANEPYFIYFSTGNVIDSGKIEGKIISENPEGFYIFCYIIDNESDESNSNENLNNSNDKSNKIDNDSSDFNNNIKNNIDNFKYNIKKSNDSATKIKIDYLQRIPDYKVQIGTNGTFTVPALKDGKYRIIAVKDVDKNSLITQQSDTIGIPISDLEIRNGNSASMQLIPQQTLDITPPEAINLLVNNRNEFTVEFSEQIILDSFDVKSFFLSHSDSSNRLYPVAFSVNNPNEIKRIKFSFAESIKNEIPYKLNFDSTKFNSKKIIKDASKNPLILPIKNIFLANSDTIPPQTTIKNYPISDSAKNIKLDTNFTLIFSNPLIFNDTVNDNFANKIKLFSDSNEIPLTFSQLFSNQISFAPKQKLDEQKTYRFEINCTDLRDIWGNILVDSMKILHFETEKSPTFLHLNGKIIDSNKCNFPRFLKIKLKGEQAKTTEFTAKINDDNTFSFPKILAGEYSIMYFCDLNENGKYDFGSLEPFVFAEPFTVIEKTVIIRERWSVDDYLIEIF